MTFGQLGKHSLTALPPASIDPAMLTFFWAELSRFSTLGDLCCELDVDGHTQQTDEQANLRSAHHLDERSLQSGERGLE